MPTERKFRIFFAFFSYGGNGGTAMLLPAIRLWWGHTVLSVARDPRISALVDKDFSDTPITMMRNRAVEVAREWGADFLVMVDSDNELDLHLRTDPEAKPFISSSLDFMIERYDKGPHVVFAPYCGPPPHPVNGGDENVYVFQWKNRETDSADPNFSLGQYTREQAFSMRGIQPAAAGPTGAIIYDMRAFNLIDHPYFEYEYTSPAQTTKASTEDVYNTRNISLAGCRDLGYNPIYCNWDAWAGHAKPKMVGKPNILCADQVAEHFKKAALSKLDSKAKALYFESPYLKEVEDGRHAMRIYGTPEPEDEIARNIREAAADNQNLGVPMPDEDRAAIRDILLEAASNRPVVRVIEVGTWIGNTAKFMHEVLKGTGVGYRIDCVDHFVGSAHDLTGAYAKAIGGSTYDRFVENVGELRGTVIFEHNGDSVDLAETWTDKADVIFIDADHSYESTKRDILAWRRHLREGGILCGHDYGVVGFEGVAQAVHEVARSPFRGGAAVSNQSAVWRYDFVQDNNQPSFESIDVRTPSESLEEFSPTGV